MNVRVIVFLSVLTLLIAAAFVTPVLSKPTMQNTGNDVAISSASVQTAAEVYAYWTPERMAEANANPMPMGITMVGQPESAGPFEVPATGPGLFAPGEPPH